MRSSWRLILFILLTMLLRCPGAFAAEPSDTSKSFTPPPREDLLKTLRPTHPRLLLTQEDLPRLSQAVRHHPVLSVWYAALKQSATRTLTQRPADYALPDGRRLLSISRKVMERVRNLSFVYLMEGDKRYAERAWQELAHAAEYPDWNPPHFLDTAEMTHAFAIGYDWLYHYLDSRQRHTVRSALVRLGLAQGLKAYRSRLGNERRSRVGDFWVTGQNNWNQVCNGGMGTGALAVADEMPELATEILGYVMHSLPRAMHYYAPDGAGTEGVTYWDYGSRYNIVLLASLQSALGTDFGLSRIDGFRQSGYYQIYLCGADRRSFNFGDCGLKTVSAPQHFWMGRHFNEPRFSRFRATTLKSTGSNGSLLDILWYDGSAGDLPRATMPLGKHFRKAEVASLRSSWDDPHAIVLAMQGGKNQNGAHRHFDLGSFILEANGERWIADLGTEHETYMRHRNHNQRWQYYRVRAEGHNTLVINPGNGPDQPIGAEADFTSFDATADHGKAVVDMSQACGKLVKQANRRFELIDRKRVVITDTLQAVEPVEVYWFAHTRAKISVSADGRTATLQRNGKSLQVSILDCSAPARFAVMAAAPLASSPHPTPQGSNRNYRKLAIHLKSIQTMHLAVQFMPAQR